MDAANFEFYEQLWSDTRLETPERFNTWPLVRALAARGGDRLEVGPGLRPRLPLERTVFVDSSRRAAARLCEREACAVVAEASSLPLPDRRFDLVGAFDVIEHVADDAPVFRELARVARDGATFVFSVPLHPAFWTGFDDLVGHFRRYDPERLEETVAAHGFDVEESAVFGMQPKTRWLLELGVRMVRRHRAKAMRWYNHVFLPLGLYLQKPLRFERGLVRSDQVDEALVVCRRRPRGG